MEGQPHAAHDVQTEGINPVIERWLCCTYKSGVLGVAYYDKLTNKARLLKLPTPFEVALSSQVSPGEATVPDCSCACNLPWQSLMSVHWAEQRPRIPTATEKSCHDLHVNPPNAHAIHYRSLFVVADFSHASSR
jgi:hypothetical protein